MADFLESPVAPFFLAEFQAGPDVVTLVHPMGSYQHKFAVFIQAKLREQLHDKVHSLAMTNPQKFYHTKKDHILKGWEKCYQHVIDVLERKYEGIFRILITYPATVKLEKEEDNEKNEESVMEKCDIKEWIAIIDSQNCKLVFDPLHFNLI